MSWYAYCLTEHPTLANGVRSRRPYVLEGIQGVNSAPVMSYPSGEFAVIVSEYDRATSKLDEKSVLEHARVVSRSFRTATVLPFRFGTIFDTEDAIRQAVRANRRTFCESVERLRGKSEMRIKLTVRDGSIRGTMEEIVLPDTVGREYLLKLREKASRERERQTKARALSHRHQVHRKISEPLQHSRQATQKLPNGRDRSVAALSFPAREGAHRRRRQLESLSICPRPPFEGAFLFMGGTPPIFSMY